MTIAHRVKRRVGPEDGRRTKIERDWKLRNPNTFAPMVGPRCVVTARYMVQLDARRTVRCVRVRCWTTSTLWVMHFSEAEFERLFTRDAWEFHGAPCWIGRSPLGSLCGYAGVGESHPLYGLDDDEATVAMPSLQVHGGLTYSGLVPGVGAMVNFPSALKALPPGGPWWYFGFDCGHSGDLCPSMMHSPPPGRWRVFLGKYRTASYVRIETENLARALLRYAEQAERLLEEVCR